MVLALWKRFSDWLNSDDVAANAMDANTLRLEFQDRYHHFKLLLASNNRALELMTELEKALEGHTPFSMKFVRSRTTRIYTRVYQMVTHLEHLAPGRYKALAPTLESLHKKLESLINPPLETDLSETFIIHFSALDRRHSDQAGMKMAGLADAANHLNIRIPDGFVITAHACRFFLAHQDLKAEIHRRMQRAEEGGDGAHQFYTLSADIRGLIEKAPLPAELGAAILGGYQALTRRYGGTPPNVAVRSSALNEDQEGISFAGIYDSALNVSEDQLIRTYKQILATAYSPSVLVYRLNRGLADFDTEMCVGVMEMIDAVSGGVMYSVNPMEIRDTAVTINSVWGLPKAVVDGTVETDLFRVSRTPHLAISHRVIGRKDQKYICGPDEGVRRMDETGSERFSPSLTDDQVLALAKMAIRIEDYFGAPQDIEWAIDKKGDIVLLQCRPLQIVPSRDTTSIEANTGLPPAFYHGGTTASPGVAAGPVRRVLKDADALRFPKGAILVTDRALARWAALLPPAVAIVSEKGSLTGHLANVAREFKTPALFGATGAVEKLTDGMMITVDADTGRIYEGVVDTLLEMDHRFEDHFLMKGTPVFSVLERAAALITPLTLTHPDSPVFKAENCKTLHDITRFCHEKSVHEMFRFGKTHRFPERSSKQLHAEIPMQWWVLNLDDGFREDVVDDSFVDISNIISVPMLALWRGITAFPWEGPPPVDGKGFMSVMFQATQNKALVPTVKSSMANRNYFMISKNYCSLQSRLGFHFAITEALVSHRSTENYISFQFKGGAADFDRRLKRVVFIKEILEHYGFRTEVATDSLRARLEQHRAQTMIAKLKILGFLTIHTRQLDMIMVNSKLVEHYRSQLMERIETLLAEPAVNTTEKKLHVDTYQP
ncbi:pyruvate, water dikinase [Desulfosarcina sp. OttesenSCG-928-A07]|nr:pyruvate, water dikinase [Desulfosarcina sp. OttesenSCG-928-G17]MDL2329166.1 pyruvate, water dikinase [Desulfosarcina sp. OttesenSCG-928-A07]